jgi:hypothetical protein
MDGHDRRDLQELPELYRRALVLADAGKRNDAIAKDLNVAVEAVKPLLEIGRAKLANLQKRREQSVSAGDRIREESGTQASDPHVSAADLSIDSPTNDSTRHVPATETAGSQRESCFNYDLVFADHSNGRGPTMTFTLTTPGTDEEHQPKPTPSIPASSDAYLATATQIRNVNRDTALRWLTHQLAWEDLLDRLRGPTTRARMSRSSAR